ncbi:Putative transcriptional regulator%2C LysR family [Mycobacteroides abscessus]|nr:Putative transcriptional regulator%2C LysR family [Mycobacteroides abscessus]
MGSRLAPLAFEFNGRDEFPCGGRECPQSPGARLIALAVAGSVDTAGLGIRMFDTPLELPAVGSAGLASTPR